MSAQPRLPPASTFVVRFWREWVADRGRWRGRIEHVQSGQGADFVELERIIAFIRALGTMADDQIASRNADR